MDRSPTQRYEHSASGSFAAKEFRLSAHQHSRSYSRPAQGRLFCAHRFAQTGTDICESDDCGTGGDRPASAVRNRDESRGRDRKVLEWMGTGRGLTMTPRSLRARTLPASALPVVSL